MKMFRPVMRKSSAHRGCGRSAGKLATSRISRYVIGRAVPLSGTLACAAASIRGSANVDIACARNGALQCLESGITGDREWWNTCS